jgi:hypothetical protein
MGVSQNLDLCLEGNAVINIMITNLKRNLYRLVANQQQSSPTESEKSSTPHIQWAGIALIFYVNPGGKMSSCGWQIHKSNWSLGF